MTKIAIVGPESSGKSTLCMALAQHYQVKWVDEFARNYLEHPGRPYTEADLLTIAHGQCALEEHIMQHHDGLLFCDTDMITIRIWSEEKYGRCAPELLALAEHRHYDHWLLCTPDIPWEPDPLRENPHDRDRLFTVYHAMLMRLDKPFTVVTGSPDERLRAAVSAVMRL
ncbi:MAG: AAA family ATPase [Flavobacteriales bacterium]|jgi:NadR type nicotinamide-nucleotide adenylyltransferase